MTTKAPAKPAAKKTETKKASSKPAGKAPAKKAEAKPAAKKKAEPAAEAGAPDLAGALAAEASKPAKKTTKKAAPSETLASQAIAAPPIPPEAPADQVPGQLAIPAEGNPAADVPADAKPAKAPKADKPAKEAKPAVSRAERAAINRENGKRGGRKPKPEGEKYEGFRVLLPPPVLAWARQKAIDADMSQSEIVMKGWIAAFGAEVADLVPAETRAKLEAVAHVGA